jgi:hypothetical protein
MQFIRMADSVVFLINSLKMLPLWITALSLRKEFCLAETSLPRALPAKKLSG